MSSFLKDCGVTTSEKVYKVVACVAIVLCFAHSYYTHWAESNGAADFFRNEPNLLSMEASVGSLPSLSETSVACCLCDNPGGDPTIGTRPPSGACSNGCEPVIVEGRECNLFTVKNRGDTYSCTAKKIISADRREQIIVADSASPCQHRKILGSLSPGIANPVFDDEEAPQVPGEKGYFDVEKNEGTRPPTPEELDALDQLAENDYWTCGPDPKTVGNCAAQHRVNGMVVREDSLKSADGNCEVEACNAMFDPVYANLSRAFIYNRF